MFSISNLQIIPGVLPFYSDIHALVIGIQEGCSLDGRGRPKI